MLTFNRLANNFHILDQVSEGMPEFYLLPEYKQVLEHEITDKEVLAKFREVRKKYQTAPLALTTGASNGNLFAPNAAELVDPIVDAFFTSNDLPQALDKLSAILTVDELSVLEKTFTKYEPVFKRLEMCDGSTIIHNLNLLNATIDAAKVAAHLALARTFYNSSPAPFKTVMLFWSPQPDMVTGFAYGDHLLIRAPRSEMSEDDILKFTISVIVHEAIHHVSAYASTEQKIRLSAIIAEQVDIKDLPHFLYALEEPLVLAIQMLFLQNNYPIEFARNRDKWISDPMVANLLSLVKQYFDAKRSIDEEFMQGCYVALVASRQHSRPVPFM